MPSKKAQMYISRKIRKLKHEGYKPKQSQAIAYAMAREKGYKVRKKL